MSRSRPAPIFVVGCSRGGTTLVQSILGQVPGTVAFPETNFLYRLMPDLQLRRYGTSTGWRPIPRLFARRLMPLTGFTNVDCGAHADRLVRGLGRPDLRALFPDGKRRLGPWFRAFDAAMTELAEGERWIEKSPQNVFCVRHIHRHIADARIVHVVRGGPENIASIIDAADNHAEFRGRFEGPDRVWRATSYWNNCLRAAVRNATRDRYEVIRYEDVVEHGVDALTGVARMLDVKIGSEMLVYRTDGIAKPDETWKSRSDDAIRAQPSKFASALSVDEQALVRARALDADRLVPRMPSPR